MVQPRSRGPTEFLTLQSSCIHGPTPLARAYRGGPGHVGAFHGSNPARAGLPKRSRPPAKRSERSNPARAGLPVRCWAGAVHSSVQTRSRGPTSFLADAEKLNAGPTPLARAYYHQPARNPADRTRSNPARAGLPQTGYKEGPGRTVQPRSRGPTAARGPMPASSAGPTPLARAYPNWTRKSRLRSGSNPARAGLPGRKATGHPGAWVQPRSRGPT